METSSATHEPGPATQEASAAGSVGLPAPTAGRQRGRAPLHPRRSCAARRRAAGSDRAKRNSVSRAWEWLRVGLAWLAGFARDRPGWHSSSSMITRTEVHAAEPAGSSGLRALRRRLRFRGAYAPADVLGPVSALHELEAICAGMLSGRGGPNVANRPSLVDDLQRALGGLGPQTRDAAGQLLVGFQSELTRLKARLDMPQGARVTALTVGRVLERFRNEAVVAASWRDTVATFLDDEETSEQCELRIAQFVELAEHRGVEFAAWAAPASGLLGDLPQAYRGTGEDIAEALKAGAKLAGVPEARRIELAEQELAILPERTAVAVWLVIDHAALRDHFEAVGPVRFYYHSLWPEQVRSGPMMDVDGVEHPAPEELDDWDDAKEVFENLEEVEHRVFARVRVDAATDRDAQQRARTVVRDLIDLAKHDSDWVLLDGAVSWSPGGWSGEGFSRPGASKTAGAAHPVHEGTAENLRAFDADFVRRWLDGDVLAAGAVDDALWTVAMERAPAPSHRIMLAIRAVERTLGQAREEERDNWAKPAARYLRSVWVNYTLVNDLRQNAVSVLNAVQHNGHASDLHARLHPVVFPPSSDENDWPTFTRGFARLAPEILQTLPEGSMEHRLARETNDVLSSPEGALKRLHELGDRFDRLLARTERQRNALTHGTGTAEAVVRGVDGFAVVLARYAANEVMHQASTGKEPLIEFERDRVQALERDSRLEAGDGPLGVLWPEA